MPDPSNDLKSIETRMNEHDALDDKRFKGIGEHLSSQDDRAIKQTNTLDRIETALVGDSYHPEVPCVMNEVAELKRQVESLLRTRRQQAKLIGALILGILTAAGGWLWGRISGRPLL